MRTIPANSLTALANRHGNESIFIVEVNWAGNGFVAYADRTVQGINGRILEVGPLENTIDVTGNNNSQEFSVTLDDTDGSIKDILDSHDVHQRDVCIYQYFEGLALADKFLLFRGKLSSPIVWSEKARTVSFRVIAQIEDKEFGFSAEEGQFPFIPKDMIGKAWPVVFGKVLDIPALQVNKAVSGSTLCGVGIISGAALHNSVPLGGSDCGLGSSVALMSEQISLFDLGAALWAQFPGKPNKQGVIPGAQKVEELMEQSNNLRTQMAQSVGNQFSQQSCARTSRSNTINDAINNGQGCNPIRILGGEDFPQNTTITLNINGGLFVGRMENDQFFVSSRRHPDNETAAQNAFSNISSDQCPQSSTPQFYDFQLDVPVGTGDYGPRNDKLRRHGFVLCNEPSASRPSSSQVAQAFWADSGSRVVLASDEPITYIVSIIPGTVLAVKAFKEFEGVRRLVNVPNNLWRVETVVYGSITAVQVVLSKPLSTLVDQGWDDDIYVTFESSVGPNTVAILRWIITNYTDLTYDNTSFNAVETKVAPFPMNFPVLDRKNTLDIIKEIAFQARCAVWLNNGVFFLKYLPEEPTTDDTVTVSEIESGISVELTRTEDLITKMVVEWRLSYADDEPERIILRHNVNKYGTKEETFDFYCFNQPDIVMKAATFWLIRKANTWKKISFKTFLTKLNLEAFDTLLLDFAGGYVANGPIKTVVESAIYNSADEAIDFVCWVPVKAGTMEQYQFAWPKTLTITDTFPTPEEISSGNAGGSGIGADATGQLPIGYTGVIGVPGQPIIWLGSYDNSYAYAVNDAVFYNDKTYVCIRRAQGVTPANPGYWTLIAMSPNQGGTVFVGGPNVIYFGQSDRGDRRPGDAGFLAQTITPNNVFADVQASPNPNPTLRLNYIDPLRESVVPQVNGSSDSQIDIRTTEVIDSDDPDAPSVLLETVFNGIRQEKLMLSTKAKFMSPEEGEDAERVAEFDFEYDEEGEVFGAGTAFLKEAEEEDGP